MQIDQLRLFLAVAGCGSFSRAAMLAGSTQSAISKRMLALEHELGCRLFHRTGRGALLTDAGRSLMPRAESLVADVDGLADAIAPGAAPRGIVRFAVQHAVSWPLVGCVHAEVSNAYPGIALQIFEAPMMQIDEWLREGRVDLAVMSRHPGLATHSDPLFADPMFLVAKAGDKATRRSTVRFAAVVSLPLITATLSNAGRVLIEEEARRRGMRLNVALELNSLGLMKRMVTEGRGYGITSRRAVALEVARGDLAVARIVEPEIIHRFYLANAGTRDASPAVRAVSEVVVAAARGGGDRQGARAASANRTIREVPA